jgi:hypothetical protein
MKEEQTIATASASVYFAGMRDGASLGLEQVADEKGVGANCKVDDIAFPDSEQLPLSPIHAALPDRILLVFSHPFSENVT